MIFGTGPRRDGQASRWGTDRTVATLWVTSSPVVPSPRVAALTKRPSS